MADAKQEIITLHRVSGIAAKSGIDDEGLVWSEYDTSGYLDINEGECEICGQEDPTDVFSCLDGGDMVCAGHVEFCCTEDQPCLFAPEYPSV